eukprot:CAMPEP_0194173814 /NCGR_PEP_ID=MMETSP0154-20130528/8089_1 /TAXON_ID=1049557 /ORGANISM="Thalassiothrix antarctica, Strain L6-D1" /LENGTH=109 /DNA_ID=CAMNT_0038887017 /DNA_START=37 /DNA_END=363 /DNA_ORIENTATION=-
MTRRHVQIIENLYWNDIVEFQYPVMSNKIKNAIFARNRDLYDQFKREIVIRQRKAAEQQKKVAEKIVKQIKAAENIVKATTTQRKSAAENIVKQKKAAENTVKAATTQK